MQANAGLSPLRGLAKLRDARTRRFSSYDRTGGNDDRLHIEPGETVTIAETTGAGIVTHIWATMSCESPHFLRKVVLRAYWDGESEPSIECPIGDFFGMGHAATRNFASLPLQMSPQDGKAFNCYFPMPFARHMRLTVTSECEHELLFYYYVDLELHGSLEPGLGRFHAQWRRAMPPGIDESGHSNEEVLFGGVSVDGADNYVILEARGARPLCRLHPFRLFAPALEGVGLVRRGRRHDLRRRRARHRRARYPPSASADDRACFPGHRAPGRERHGR